MDSEASVRGGIDRHRLRVMRAGMRQYSGEVWIHQQVLARKAGETVWPGRTGLRGRGYMNQKEEGPKRAKDKQACNQTTYKPLLVSLPKPCPASPP